MESISRRNNMGVKYEISGNRVTAKIDGCEMDFVNLMRKWFKGQIPKWIPQEMFHMTDSFEASANCDPADGFDEDIGKELAKHYMLTKYNREFKHKVDTLELMVSTIEKALNAAKEHSNKREVTSQNREKYIREKFNQE